MNPLAIEKEVVTRSYYQFFKSAWKVLEPQTPFEDNWHIKYLCDRLQSETERIARREPKTKDLIINIPPRSLKSMIITVMWNAWTWIKYPHINFITASYSGDLATEHALKTRRLIESDWYTSLFDSFEMTSDQNVKSRFENDRTGSRRATSVGGTVTGGGADIIIADDPHKVGEVHSLLSRETVTTWWNTTMFSRLNDQRIGLRLVVMQRLHEDDLTGYLLSNDFAYDLICLPAENAEDVVPKELSQFYINNLLSPERFGNNFLHEAKKSLGVGGYTGQYLQKPSPDEGNILKPTVFYDVVDLARCDLYGYIDLAISEKETADYTCIVTVARDRETGKLYVIEPTRIRGNVQQQMDLVFNMFAKYKWSIFGVESVAYQKAFFQWLNEESRKRGVYIPTREILLDKDKVRRALEISPHVDNGTILFNNSYQEFMAEIMQFPKATHDDYVDAFVGAAKLALEGTSMVEVISRKGIIYPK